VESLSFLGNLREEFIVLGLGFLSCFEVFNLLSLEELLSSDSLLCDESLDLW